jgi:hypothetical protein
MAQLTEEQRAQIRALRAAEGKDAARAMRFKMRTQAGLPTNPANVPSGVKQVVQQTPEELARKEKLETLQMQMELVIKLAIATRSHKVFRRSFRRLHLRQQLLLQQLLLHLQPILID